MTFPSYESLMILKNIALVFSGFMLCLVVLSLLFAYYMLNITRDNNQTKDIAFTYSDNKIRLTSVTSLSEALDTFYSVIIFNVVNSSQPIVKRNETRGKLIFLGILTSFIVFFVAGTWLSIDIQVLECPKTYYLE